MPQPPVVSIAFESLLGTGEGFDIFTLGVIAVGDVTPSFMVSVVDRNGVSEAEDSFLIFFLPHVGTSTCKPFVREELVDSKTEFETLNGFREIVVVEMNSGQRSHGTSRFLFTFYPSSLVVRAISLDITEEAEDVGSV